MKSSILTDRFFNDLVARMEGEIEALLNRGDAIISVTTVFEPTFVDTSHFTHYSSYRGVIFYQPKELGVKGFAGDPRDSR